MATQLRSADLVIYWPDLRSPFLCKRYGKSEDVGWVRAIYDGSVTDLPECNVLQPPDRLPILLSSEFGRA